MKVCWGSLSSCSSSPVPRLGRFVGGHAGLSVGGQRALGRDGEADTDGVMCQPD